MSVLAYLFKTVIMKPSLMDPWLLLTIDGMWKGPQLRKLWLSVYA